MTFAQCPVAGLNMQPQRASTPKNSPSSDKRPIASPSRTSQFSLQPSQKALCLGKVCSAGWVFAGRVVRSRKGQVRVPKSRCLVLAPSPALRQGSAPAKAPEQHSPDHLSEDGQGVIRGLDRQSPGFQNAELEHREGTRTHLLLLHCCLCFLLSSLSSLNSCCLCVSAVWGRSAG